MVFTTSNDKFSDQPTNSEAGADERVAMLQAEIAELRRAVQDAPLRVRALEEKLDRILKALDMPRTEKPSAAPSATPSPG